MSFGFDIIITTYNRPTVITLIASLCRLCQQGRIRGKVIVVDSSESNFGYSPGFDTFLVHVKSHHRNQPYQRYLGLMASSQEYVLFLDDDMEIIDDTFCEKLGSLIDPNVVAINLKFKNDNFFLSNLQGTVIPKKGFASVLRWLSGYPSISPNRLWLAGLRGKREDNRPIEFLSGGSFLARRDLMFSGISSQLFDVYERGMGKGEDAIIGFALSRLGTVLAHDETYFVHNDQGNSIYTASLFKFNKRVAYSRLFLSFEYCRLTGRSKLLALLHYVWYSFGRVAGVFFNFVLKPGKKQWAGMIGYISGVLSATFQLTPIYLLNRENRNRSYWDREVSSDPSTVC